LRRATIFGLVLLAGSAATAEEPATYYSNEGDVYLGMVNENGAVLTSKYLKSWFHGEPTDDLRVHTKHAVIYLGNGCDALLNEYGEGRWIWWNDNFTAKFGDHSITFANQELFDLGNFFQCEDHA
jgi:hypothetical protein